MAPPRYIVPYLENTQPWDENSNRCRVTPFASGCILRRAEYNFIWWKSRLGQTVRAPREVENVYGPAVGYV